MLARMQINCTHCQWGRQMAQPLWKHSGSFFKNPKMQLQNDPAIALLDIYHKEVKRVAHTQT